ncbi:MAG: histone deacetylase family protein, partial [Burkholderiales bacterium]|nr:histone deacetylase family protein [Burkholderiales bacterium]
MQVFLNPVHALHQGRHEMFRGRLVPCVEVPDRVTHVQAELQRRGIGRFQAPADVDMARLARVHEAGYLQFLQTAWSDWLALDPANAAF